MPVDAPTLTKMVLEFVEERQGMKGVELAMVMAKVFVELGMKCEPESVTEFLAELVKTGDLVEIEYILPSMPERVKSFYLPKGTIVAGQRLKW